VKKLKKCFDGIDLDNTGEISVNEFIHFAAAKDTIFVRAFLSKVLCVGWVVGGGGVDCCCSGGGGCIGGKKKDEGRKEEGAVNCVR
jgi:hypothetical protein